METALKRWSPFERFDGRPFFEVWRDMVCAKLLGDSSFPGLFAHQAIGGFSFSGFACAWNY